jgi:hypothetical protein
MPRAEILSKQAMHTLTQLHAELAGKIETNRKSGDKPRSQMVERQPWNVLIRPKPPAPSRRGSQNPPVAPITYPNPNNRC